jgi:DNA-binding NtrC family response regulator
LLAYRWPGNIRELKNVIERAMILSTSDELLPLHLPQDTVGQADVHADTWNDPWEQWLNLRPVGPVSLDEINGRLEKHLVRGALEVAKHNRMQATELLGLAKVDQLRYLMKKYDID